MSALARLQSFGSAPAGGTLRRLAQVRGLRLALRAGLMALAAAGLVAGGLEAAADLLALGRPAGQALATGAVSWSDINRPIALYDLAGTEFGKLPLGYRARRRRPDGAREDVLTFGTLGTAKPYLQLSLLRAGPDAPGDGGQDGLADGLADALARLAGLRGLTATRIRDAAPVDTRFGRIEAADLLLWQGGTATPCLGFRGGASDGGVLRVAGFACGAPGRPVGRAALACAVDRIDLVSAGDDAALRAVFVAAARRSGSACLGALAAGSLGRAGRLGWLDPGADMPPLRGLFAATARQR